MTRVEVVTLGEAMGLMLADGRSLEHATTFHRSVAGAESNVAVGLARLGHTVSWSGRVGNDALGRSVLRALRGEGVQVRAEVDEQRSTGLLLRDAPADRPVTVSYYRSGSAGSMLGRTDLDETLIRGAAVLHVTGLTAMLSDSARDAVTWAIAVARESGTTVSFDPNVRLRLAPAADWRDRVVPLLAQADVALVGADEAAALGGADALAWCRDLGVERVVVKDGVRGACEAHGDQVWRAPARRVAAVDPVGAGDAFAAGWLSAWLRGVEPGHRLHEAAVVASCAVAAYGDLDGLPDAWTRDRIVEGDLEVSR